MDFYKIQNRTKQATIIWKFRINYTGQKIHPHTNNLHKNYSIISSTNPEPSILSHKTHNRTIVELVFDPTLPFSCPCHYPSLPWPRTLLSRLKRIAKLCDVQPLVLNPSCCVQATLPRRPLPLLCEVTTPTAISVNWHRLPLALDLD